MADGCQRRFRIVKPKFNQNLTDRPGKFCFKLNIIVTKTDTIAAIRKGRGILKRRRKSGDKPFAVEWAEHKREEMKLEESKFVCCTASRPTASKPKVR